MTDRIQNTRPLTQIITGKQNKIRATFFCLSLFILLIACSPQVNENEPAQANNDQAMPTHTPVQQEPIEIAPMATKSSDFDAYLDTLADAGFSGTILIAQQGQIVADKAYGYANIADEVPITTQTVFDSGSLSKQFTAAAILHLQEQVHLQLDDTLADFFENVPADKADITIHQLLTHTAGFPGYVYIDDFTATSRDEAQEMAFQAELLSEPGTEHFYSDTGYGILAIIVELVSGQSFQTYLHENLFAPAGMENTGFYNDPRWDNLTVANGYNNDTDFGTAATRPGPYWGLLGFGGVLTTSGDLYKWGQGLKAHTILTEESVNKLFTPYVREFEGEDSFYGYGWVVLDTEEYGRVIFHDGATDSHNAIMIMAEDHDTTIIVMSNRIDETADREVFYGTDTGIAVGRSYLSNDFGILPEYAQ